MSDNETGTLRPDEELTDVFRGVARDVGERDHGALKAATNKALLEFLAEAPDDVVQYHLDRTVRDDLAGLSAAVEARQNQPFPEVGDDG